MKEKVKKVVKIIFASVVLVALVCVINVQRARSYENSDSVMITQPIGTSGTKIKMVKITDRDGFSKTISIEGAENIPVIIGSRQCAMGNNGSLLISIDGYEKIVRIPIESACGIMNDDHDGDSDEHDIPFTLCVLDAVVDMLINISECGENEDDEHEDHDEHDYVSSCSIQSILYAYCDY